MFVIDPVALVFGFVPRVGCSAVWPPFFREEVLHRDTPTLVPEELGSQVGLSSVEEASAAEGWPGPLRAGRTGRGPGSWATLGGRRRHELSVKEVTCVAVMWA